MGTIRAPMRRFRRIMRELFFFQAEDGIRDVAVTGVQTCALPISVIFVGGAPHAFPPSPGIAAILFLLALLFVALGGVLLRSEEHTSELQSRLHLVCRLLLEKKNKDR